MRKLLLLPLLALLAAPLPAAAQSNSQLFCFANDTLAVQTRVRDPSDPERRVRKQCRVDAGGRQVALLRTPREAFGVRFQVQSWNARWEAAANCGRTIWQPSGRDRPADERARLNFICSEE
jgi:hypothetical protein